MKKRYPLSPSTITALTSLIVQDEIHLKDKPSLFTSTQRIDLLEKLWNLLEEMGASEFRKRLMKECIDLWKSYWQADLDADEQEAMNREWEKAQVLQQVGN